MLSRQFAAPVFTLVVLLAVTTRAEGVDDPVDTMSVGVWQLDKSVETSLRRVEQIGAYNTSTIRETIAREAMVAPTSVHLRSATFGVNGCGFPSVLLSIPSAGQFGISCKPDGSALKCLVTTKPLEDTNHKSRHRVRTGGVLIEVITFEDRQYVVSVYFERHERAEWREHNEDVQVAVIKQNVALIEDPFKLEVIEETGKTNAACEKR